jgi:ribonuclease HI
MICGRHRKEIYGGHPDSTNNRMEMTAAIEALSALKRPCRVTLHSDSNYLVRGMTEWLAGWKRNNWKRRNEPVLNRDLWEALDALARQHDIEWVWVRGHAGNPLNEACDRLAGKAIEEQRAGLSRES